VTQESSGISRRAWAGAAVAGVAAAAAGAWLASRGGLASAGSTATGVAATGPLPSPLQTLDGRTITNADIAGRSLLLNFWAPWCPPCVKEMPELDRFAHSAAGANTLVIGLAIDERPAVDKFVAAHPVGFPIAVLGYAGLAWVRRLSNDANVALPFSAVYDRSQKLVQKKFGPTTEAELSGWAVHL
jgi:thiol-disulfide isomerase/thioredoxin